MQQEGDFGAVAATNSGNNNNNHVDSVNSSGSEEVAEDGEEPQLATVGRGVKRQRREYKKDTIYLYDLYTLTYDENEQVESIEMFNSIENESVSMVGAVWVGVGVDFYSEGHHPVIPFGIIVNCRFII